MATLKSGSKGGAVKKLQEQLNKAGAKPKLNTDGLFGNLTAEAVKAVQKKNGLKVDGIAGKQTEAALGGGSGGKGGGPLPDGARENLKNVQRVYSAFMDDWMDCHDSFNKALKQLKGKRGLSDKEKEKLKKPMMSAILKCESGQKKLAGALVKNEETMAKLDQKSPDRSTKLLIKKSQVLNQKTKKYHAYIRTTKRKGAALVDDVVKKGKAPTGDIRDSINGLYCMNNICFDVMDARDAAWKEIRRVA